MDTVEIKSDERSSQWSQEEIIKFNNLNREPIIFNMLPALFNPETGEIDIIRPIQWISREELEKIYPSFPESNETVIKQ